MISFEQWEGYIKEAKNSKSEQERAIAKTRKELTQNKKENEKRIFDILTQHEYDFDFIQVESNNSYATQNKRYYTDSHVRRALVQIKKTRGVNYLNNATIDKIEGIVKRIKGLEKALDNHMPQSNPRNWRRNTLHNKIEGEIQSLNKIEWEIQSLEDAKNQLEYPDAPEIDKEIRKLKSQQDELRKKLL